MQQKRSTPKQVLDELKKIRCKDSCYSDGKILCSMCTKPHFIAEKAYRMFLSANLGDLGLFPGAAQLESEVVADLAGLVHGENCVGFVVSGGTEANLIALLAARNAARKAEPTVILPQSAHFSFIKICSMLNLKPVYAPLDSDFKVDVSAVEKLVDENTVAIVGTAGTAELGAVDPIEKLACIAAEQQVHLHVDAAFGGLILPFLPAPQPKFGFDLAAVKSITVDPHKMGMAAIPAGSILFRDATMLDAVKTETPYLSSHYQYTFTGTRSGASVASAWAVFRLLGVEGFKKTVAECMKNTRFLVNGLKSAGFQLVLEPTLNIVAFRSSKGTQRLATHLMRSGWFVSYIPRYDCVRTVLMPHTKKRHVKSFLAELQSALS